MSSLRLLNSGGFIPIGSEATLLIGVHIKGADTFRSCRWNLTGTPQDDFSSCAPISSSEATIRKGLLVASSDPTAAIISIDSTTSDAFILDLKVPFAQLDPGKYELTADIQTARDSLRIQHSFIVIWPNRPMSLSKTSLAFDALRHIATEEEMSTLDGLGTDEAVAYFRQFWRNRASDSTSAANAAMAEYYRRVDETIKRFSIGNDANGYKSDRGRIFILFGAPSSQSRSMKPNASPTETWTYIKSKKRFVFEDRERNGNYLLTAMDEW